MPVTPLQQRFPLVGPYPPHFTEAEVGALLMQHLDHPIDPQDALQVLVLVLHHVGHLNDALLVLLSRICMLPLADLHALRSFYSFLDQTTSCRYRIQVSTNIIDDQCGARQSLSFLQEHYKNKQDIVIAPTSCTGFSDLAPGALINGIPVTGFTVERARVVAGLIDGDIPLSQWPEEFFNYQTQVWQKDILLNLDILPGAAVSAALNVTPAVFIEQLKQSGLRGRGGAGFPTWQKWSTAAALAVPQKYVICNADEGEPGTFKDRVLLERYFDAVIEGMQICGWAIGATTGLIYLRGEYAWLYDTLQQRLTQYQCLRHQYLRPDSGFDIRIHLGAGAYVCGEESALIESLEGKRGIPRIRPPFPAQQGYRGAPTVVNNVETFCAVTWIALHSAQAFAALGTENSQGTKLHSVSGDCKKPGIYELPLGTTTATLLALCQAEDTLAVQVGGPSGRLLFSESFDIPIDFSHVSSGGSFMVFSHQRDELDILRNFSHFFAHESCGFCTPCRAGTQAIARLFDQIHANACPPNAETELRELSQLLRYTSHCGLGQTAVCALKDFMRQRPERFSTLTTPSRQPASSGNKAP